MTTSGMAPHRHPEFIRFLNAVEAAVPPGKLVHAIADDCAAHRHPKVRAGPVRHPRRTIHVTPARASSLMQSRASSPNWPGNSSNAASSDHRRASSPPRPTPTLGRSSGPSIRIRSSQPSNEAPRVEILSTWSRHHWMRSPCPMEDDRTELRRLHRAPEPDVLAPLLELATLPPDGTQRVDARARSLVHAARAAHRPGADVTDFLAEYGLGTTKASHCSASRRHCCVSRMPRRPMR